MNDIQFYKKQSWPEKIVLMIVFAWILVVPAQSQNQYRFSQFMFNELSINPAYAGTQNGFLTNLIYRNQWMNIEGQPTTQILSMQAPVANKKVGLGGILYKESIGIQNDIGGFVSYAYHVRFGASTYHSDYKQVLLTKQ